MSEGGSDSTYKPKTQQRRKHIPVAKRPVRSTRAVKDYTEPLLISDSEDLSEGEGTLVRSDLDNREDTTSLESVSVKSEVWTPRTFLQRTDSLIKNITEFREQTQHSMAKETSLAEVMQLMVQMRADDRADDFRREQERLLEQERRE